MAFKFKSGSAAASQSPATPNRKANKSSLFSQAPSTTPAGEPPSYLTTKSTTPAGHPPRSSKLFGSSYNASNNTFGHRGTPGRRGRAFAVPESSPPLEYMDEDMDADGEVVDEGYGTQTGHNAREATFLSSMREGTSPRGLKRSRNGQVRTSANSGMTEIARSYARDAGPAQLDDPDDIVLQTENILSHLDTLISEQPIAERDETLTHATSQLTNIWSRYADLKTMSGGVGPDANDGFTKANYLASLLLQLHNPHSRISDATSATSKLSRALVNPLQSASLPIPIPRALLDWLNTYHKPLGDDFNEIHMFRPSPSAHESFWDLVGGELLRGQFLRVARLLKDAGFEDAITAQDDGSGRSGYEGKQLENVEEVVGRFVRLLESCPAVRYDDWDIKGAEWSVFRQRTRHAIKDLETFSKGTDRADEAPPTPPQGNIFDQSANAPNFGSMAAASLRAGSRVPWTIYENLKTLYGVLLGGNEIIDFAQDWVEASICLTVWWDGEDNDGADASLRRSRGPPGFGAGTREVDVSPLTAYRRQLGDMFRTVTDEIEETNFQPDSLDPVQVGLVCVIEDSIEAVIEMLRTWDLTVTVAVVELAALGAWLPLARPSSRGLLERGFSTEDLMVLSHSPGTSAPPTQEAVDRDEVLSRYADLLANHDTFRSSDGKVEKEGWELAVSVLGRLDDSRSAQTKITHILEEIQFQDEGRVDKVLELCASMGLVEQERGIAEHYADTLADGDGDAYGPALIYYARAHATGKLKSTVSFLISLCLLQSAAVPSTPDLDSALASLLSVERTVLVDLATVDLEAATLLSGQISGYATVRRFYDLRDNASGALRSLERRREAAKALVVIIESASDCIRGGLFDPDVQSVVPTDGLLTLIGEALPLLDQDTRVFSKHHVFTLMRVIEDFDTAPARIRQGAVELLQASMNAYRGSSAPSKKSKSAVSSMSGSGLSGSSWDMVLSSRMLHSAHSAGKAEEAGRSWDWRRGLDAVAGAQIEAREVLLLLRMALAKEVARGWGGSVEW